MGKKNHQKVDITSMKELRNDYLVKTDFLADLFSSVNAYDFYREIFPEGSLQAPGVKNDGKYRAVANVLMIRKRDGGMYRKNYLVDDSLSKLGKWVGNEAFMAPCSFVGQNKDLDHLREVYGLVVDLDDVGMEQATNVVHQINTGYLPRPTFLVNSGTGFHLYYVFDKPVHYYKDNSWLYALKRALITICWNGFTSANGGGEKDRQYSGLVQPYRIPGTATKLDKDQDGHIATKAYPVLAFKTGQKWDIDKLMSHKPSVPSPRWERDIEHVHELRRCGRTPLPEAKEKWPEWYDKRIVQGLKPKKAGRDYRYHLSPNVYRWWLRRIYDEIKEPGHRYHCVFILSIYALKCDIPFERLKKDVYKLVPHFEALTTSENNHFTFEEANQAMLVYRQPEYVTFPLSSIEHLSGLTVERNKRNGRTRQQHLKLVNTMRKVKRDVMGEDEYAKSSKKPGQKDNKPRKNTLKLKSKIRSYAARHPGAKQKEIAEACGVTRQTVAKYLKDWQPKSKAN